MTREIILTQGKVALVDDEDFEWLNQWKWCASRSRSKWYALRYVKMPGIKGTRFVVRMHRIILETPKDIFIDHIDMNSLNNQRNNLRFATNAENRCNVQKQSTSTSGYKGVSFHKHRGLWQARIMTKGKSIHLGYFDTAEEAATAYDEAAKKYHGEFARLNFNGENYDR